MLTFKKTQYTEFPFLSIITRVYKRPIGLSKNLQSVESQHDVDLEQIFITDDTGVGMLEANRSFSDPSVTSLIDGQYVYLLDDDDFIVNSEMITELKQIAENHESPDVIFFRMTIKNGMNNNHYPTEKCWSEKRPMIAHIGGSCFVVKKEVYLKHIHNFAHARCGDFYFIDSVFCSGVSMYWHDKLMAETDKVSRGASE